MLVALHMASLQRISALDARRKDGPFYCPVCKAEVILHKGMVRVHHFAHKPESNCQHGAGETELHRRAKFGIQQTLTTTPGLQCNLEVPLDGVRADVLVASSATNRRYAIEIQISQLSMPEIIERTRRYARLGVYVLWLFEWKPELLTERYSPSLKERWAHALYFGRVYYWRASDEVTPVKFSKHLLYRPESTWFEDGERMEGGGYSYTSKRFRTPIVCKSLFISRDFYGVDRQAWSGGDITIPACRILTARSL